MAYPYDCQVCGEECGQTPDILGCKFNDCVHYVDQLERVLRYAQCVKRGPGDSPGLQIEIEKAIEMGKSMGRPFDWAVKT